MTTVQTWQLEVPDVRGQLTAIICPDVLFVAWHRHAMWELLDENGHNKLGYPPQDSLWRVKAYHRVEGGPDQGWARYEPLP